MSATRYAVSVRRNTLIKSIQNIQREQIKANKRQTLFNSINPLSQVHRMKQLLRTYNIQYFAQEILEILASVARHAQTSEFCIELKSSCLMEDLFQVILGEVKRKPYLDSSYLVEMLICTTQGLVARASYFLEIIQDNLDLFLFALHKYPLNNKIVEKVAGFINYTQLANSRWKQQCLSQKIPEQTQKIIQLMQIYILREGYQNWSGSADFVECIERGELRWLKNAVYVFQISYSLLLMSSERQEILKTNCVRQSLAQGLAMYAKKCSHLPLIEEESSDCEFWSDSTQYPLPMGENQQLWSYFMILVLDVCLLREQVISEQQALILKQALHTALQQLARGPNLGQIAIKIMRILYEQVILDEDDLGNLVDRYPSLAPFVETIINSDFL